MPVPGGRARRLRRRLLDDFHLSVESVRFAELNKGVESVAPYSLYGNTGGEFAYDFFYPDTPYTIAATAYSEDNATGEVLATRSLSFSTSITVDTTPTALSAELFDVGTGQTIRQLSAEETIALISIGSDGASIRFEFDPPLIGCVHVVADPPVEFVDSEIADRGVFNELVPPYTLYDRLGEALGWQPSATTYTFDVTPIAGSDCLKLPGTTQRYTLTFE